MRFGVERWEGIGGTGGIGLDATGSSRAACNDLIDRCFFSPRDTVLLAFGVSQPPEALTLGGVPGL